MNNFLDNFTDRKYDKTLDKKEQSTTQNPETEPPSKELKDIASPPRTKATEEPKSLSSKGKRKRADAVEVVNRDPNYQKQKIIQHGLLVLAVLILLVGSFLFYRMLNQSTLPNFVDKPISELQKWAKDNSIELDIGSDYSMKYDQDKVMSVSEKTGTKLQSGDFLKVKVSLGANPEEKLVLPDFAKDDEIKIKEWIQENRAYNLKISKEYNETVEKSKFIRLEFSDKEMTSETYRRKDYATIFVSKGKETYEKNIEVPQFVNEDASKVSEWTTKNELKLKQNEEYSNTVEAGKVISQSVPAKEKVAKKDEFTIAVSKGKATVVPNFRTYNLHTINEQGSETGVAFIVVERYNPSVAYGQLISQSVPAGTVIEAGNVDSVILVYSIGNPFINRDDVVGKSEKDLRDFFFVENEKGANITYILQNVSPNACLFKPAIKGISCGASYDNQFIQIGSQIIIKIPISDSPIND